jgi:two-component system, OmpR family, sensor kinase
VFACQAQCVGGDRLTRQELGWLLAQEARGAAKSLRAEVTELRASLPPKRSSGDADRTSSLPAEKSLNALDEAIALLGKLEAGTKQRSRRGRIDLAALLMEVAPECRIEIEPGAGTEVVGDEDELRRMLHLLLSAQTGPANDTKGARAIGIRREGAWIRITAELGPDTGATSEIERRWLSRMAVRHGGKLELHGRQQSILLPAETSNKEEVDGLRRELFEAQQLGETYARELATILGGALHVAPTAAAPATHFEIVRAMAAALLPTLTQVSAALNANGPASVKAAPLMGEAPEMLLRELVGELTSVAQLRGADTRRVDLRSSVHAALARGARRAHRRQVSVSAGVLDPCPVDGSQDSLDALVRNALDHAIAASPAGWTVKIDLHNHGATACLSIHDGGPPVPTHLATELLQHHLDAGSLGRPTGIALLLCHALLEQLGGQIEFAAEEQGNLTRFYIPVTG